MLARAACRSLAASTRLRAFGARTIVTKKYTKEHEVLAYDSETRVGTMSISDYAQASLGQVAFVELPAVGADVKQEANWRSGEHQGCVRHLCADIGQDCRGERGAVEQPGPHQQGPRGRRLVVQDRGVRGRGEGAGRAAHAGRVQPALRGRGRPLSTPATAITYGRFHHRDRDLDWRPETGD